MHEFNELEYYQVGRWSAWHGAGAGGAALVTCWISAQVQQHHGLETCCEVWAPPHLLHLTPALALPPPLPAQIIPGTESYRYNFWGYSTVGYFAPMSRYSAAAASGGGGTDVLNEFKQMVKVRWRLDGATAWGQAASSWCVAALRMQG